MCEFCDSPGCNLTKKEILERGSIIENNAIRIVRLATDETPQTYSFEGVPCYNSLSALIPDEDDENPHSYLRFDYDEDENCENGWTCLEIMNPLIWQTEKEFLEKSGQSDMLDNQ